MKRSAVLFAGVGLMLLSCAPTRYPPGLALRRAGAPPIVAAPKTLRADLVLIPRLKGAPSLSTRLNAEPNRRYRFDVTGFSSQILASCLWADKRWTLLLHERREAWEGAGDSIDLGNIGLRIPDIHAALGFLWGEPLPGFQEREDTALNWSADTLRWTTRGVRWQARFDSTTGICREARSPALLIRYGNYRRFENRVAPAEVELFVNGESVLLLKVKQIEDSPVWKRDPFVLTVPPGYFRRQATPEP